jgi:hypothetical protein|tara:strand:- start:114 stop:260 length:147 start_codon:yes stop_codon:yes gene_type:complete
MKFLIVYLSICLFLQFLFFPYLKKVENYQNEKMEQLRAVYSYVNDDQF